MRLLRIFWGALATGLLLATLSISAPTAAAHRRVPVSAFSLAYGRSYGYIYCEAGGAGAWILACSRVSDGLIVDLANVSGTETIIVAAGHIRPRWHLPVVRPGDVWSTAGVTCRIGTRGLICLDSHGHGWWLGRLGGQRWFGPTRTP